IAVAEVADRPAPSYSSGTVSPVSPIFPASAKRRRRSCAGSPGPAASTSPADRAQSQSPATSGDTAPSAGGSCLAPVDHDVIVDAAGAERADGSGCGAPTRFGPERLRYRRHEKPVVGQPCSVFVAQPRARWYDAVLQRGDRPQQSGDPRGGAGVPDPRLDGAESDRSPPARRPDGSQLPCLAA